MGSVKYKLTEHGTLCLQKIGEDSGIFCMYDLLTTINALDSPLHPYALIFETAPISVSEMCYIRDNCNIVYHRVQCFGDVVCDMELLDTFAFPSTARTFPPAEPRILVAAQCYMLAGNSVDVRVWGTIASDNPILSASSQDADYIYVDRKNLDDIRALKLTARLSLSPSDAHVEGEGSTSPPPLSTAVLDTALASDGTYSPDSPIPPAPYIYCCDHDTALSHAQDDPVFEMQILWRVRDRIMYYKYPADTLQYHSIRLLRSACCALSSLDMMYEMIAVKLLAVVFCRTPMLMLEGELSLMRLRIKCQLVGAEVRKTFLHANGLDEKFYQFVVSQKYGEGPDFSSYVIDCYEEHIRALLAVGHYIAFDVDVDDMSDEVDFISRLVGKCADIANDVYT